MTITAGRKRTRAGCRSPLRSTLAANAVAVAVWLVGSGAWAADWAVEPSLKLRELYTDNVDLAPREAARSDWVTELSPGISVTGTGRHVDVRANYLMQNFYYKNKDERRTDHLLEALGKAELVDDVFFIDGKASVSRQNVSAFGPQAVDNANTPGNRARVATYVLSPYLQHRFGNVARGEARYVHGRLNTDAIGVFDANLDQLQLKLTNGTAFRTFGWGFQHLNRRIDYSNDASLTLRKTTAVLRYALNQDTALTLTSGHEKYNYLSLGDTPEGYFWLVGAEWIPSERTSVVAGAGRRFYGNTYMLQAKHRIRNATFRLTYDEDLTSSQGQLLLPANVDIADFIGELLAPRLPDPVTRGREVETLVRNTGLPSQLTNATNTFTNEVFLQKRAQASVALAGSRNTVVVNVFSTQRQPQSAGLTVTPVIGAQDDTRQHGAYALWNVRLAPRTQGNASVEFVRTASQSSVREDELKAIRIGAVTQFRPKLAAGIELRHVRQDSNVAAGSYRENAIAATVYLTF